MLKGRDNHFENCQYDFEVVLKKIRFLQTSSILVKKKEKKKELQVSLIVRYIIVIPTFALK